MKKGMVDKMFDIKREVTAFESELIALRRDFHENPELGFKEFRTSKIIYDYLKKIDIEVKNIAKTGVVGTLKGTVGEGKTILLRANMDALPVDEKTGLEFSSIYEGIMHASGHDGHMAILLVVAKIMARHRNEFKGYIKFVFQPNEEEAGALDMINEGVLENPKVDAAFAVHLWSPIKSGRIGLSSGPVLGTTEEFEITVFGKAGNTSSPHNGRDAILGAAKIIDSLQVLSTREYDPLCPTAIMVGQIRGGTARNIISDQVKLGGTIRFLFPDEKNSKERILAAFKRVVRGICEVMALEYDILFIPSNPSLINDASLVSVVKKSAEAVYETNENVDEFKSLVGEDFAVISQRIPSVMTFLGIGNPDEGSIYPHHHPQFTIDENIMKYGAELHIRTALKFLNG
ncbi:MAG: amidohydrolase [Lachnospiraceae bacterium]|nr:amidohydrolase [Lachnospiraceae bacterium]